MTTPAVAPSVRTLSKEEQNDLRARVLRGEELTLEQARDVLATIRSGQALLPVDKPKKARGAKSAMSLDALNADLANLGL